MKVQLSLSADVYYHGTKKKFTAFSEYRPAFFTKSLSYAQEYGPIIMKAHLDIKHVFDTRTDKRAVSIFNDLFIASGLAQSDVTPIKLGTPVHFNHADELWAFLAVPEYQKPHYDGIVVSEGSPSKLHSSMAHADVAYVPLHVNQIKLVR